MPADTEVYPKRLQASRVLPAGELVAGVWSTVVGEGEERAGTTEDRVSLPLLYLIRFLFKTIFVNNSITNV